MYFIICENPLYFEIVVDSFFPFIQYSVIKNKQYFSYLFPIFSVILILILDVYEYYLNDMDSLIFFIHISIVILINVTNSFLFVKSIKLLQSFYLLSLTKK